MPAAMGLALPATAHAATTGPTHSDATHTGGKTVSLRHSSIRPARGSIAAASSGGASLASPQASQAGCHGNTNRKLGRVGNVKGQLWYANNFDDSNTCIGTIDASIYFAHTYCKSAGVSITVSPYDIGHPTKRTAKVCGTKGQWTVHAFGIHEEFSHLPVESGVVISIWSQYGGPTVTRVGS